MPTVTRKRATNRKGTTTPKEKKVPQPKNPDVTEQEANESAAWTALVDRATSGDTLAANEIRGAIQLEKRRSDLMKEIQDNRELLRLLDRRGTLDDDQAEFLDIFYPEKERGSRRQKDDIEATRKAREAARKTGGG